MPLCVVLQRPLHCLLPILLETSKGYQAIPSSGTPDSEECKTFSEREGTRNQELHAMHKDVTKPHGDGGHPPAGKVVRQFCGRAGKDLAHQCVSIVLLCVASHIQLGQFPRIRLLDTFSSMWRLETVFAWLHCSD